MLNVEMEIRAAAVLLMVMQLNAWAKLTNYNDNVADVVANALTMGLNRTEISTLAK